MKSVFSHLLVPPTGTYVIENTGSSRLYVCIMVPNEDFAKLIRSGTPVELDEENLAVLTDFPVPP